MDNSRLGTFLGATFLANYPPGSRGFYGPNHTYAEADANGDLKILRNPVGLGDTWGPVPKDLQHASYSEPHQDGETFINPGGKKVIWRAGKGFEDTGETMSPMAEYNSDGSVKTAGWLPSGQYAEKDGTIWQPAVGGTSDPTNEFITTVVNAAQKFVGTK